MRFRPCIDIHDGKVKQIVGGSLYDGAANGAGGAVENFVSEKDAAFYAGLYRARGLYGGHVILLNPPSSPFYEATKAQALLALQTFPGGLMLGGGVKPENAEGYLKAGASHVIVTSYVFKDGQLSWEHLKEMVRSVGRRRLALDLSCRKRGEDYFVVTDRWQKFTKEKLDAGLLERLSESCDEFLVHAVDVEGKASGVDLDLVRLLSESPLPVTYAGGVGSREDLALLYRAGLGRVDVTVGSALDLFGGSLSFEELSAGHFDMDLTDR